MTETDLTQDALLNGRVRLWQPVSGLRAGIDAVFLAAAVPAVAGEMVLDAGTGSGAAALCLATRVAGVRVVGLDVQMDLVRLANRNAQENGMRNRFEAILGDLTRPPPRLAPGGFDHVMANPPYVADGRGTLPPDSGKARAVAEGEVDLVQWVRFCARMVRAKGTVTLIHRADRLDALLAAASGPLGDLVVFPLWPGGGKPAKRVLVQGRKGVAAPMRLSPGLTLHGPDGGFTEAAEAVLRGAGGVHPAVSRA